MISLIPIALNAPSQLITDAHIILRPYTPLLTSFLKPFGRLRVLFQIVVKKSTQCVHSQHVAFSRRFFILADGQRDISFDFNAVVVIFTQFE